MFPGQFDPITNGHVDVDSGGVLLFDDLVVTVGINPDKREMFALEERLSVMRQVFGGIPNVTV